MEKGQIISLDFVFSLVLVVLALGLLVRVSEANNYRMKQEEIFGELQRVGRVASASLANSEEFTCQVNDIGGAPIYNPVNCIDKGELNGKLGPGLGKSDLRMSNEFEYKIAIGAETWESAPLDEDNTPNYYSEKRKVIVNNGAMTKAEMENCMETGCAEETLTLWVWRSA